ncbi:MAG TPA: hypothetical protein VLI06_07900, partial [Solimonas sp.]|nr:hypothetical protein [Solimonas sp.]
IGCSETGFTAQTKTISNGQTVCVRHTASAAAGATVTTTLSIGGINGTFSSTTVAPDTTPDSFAFTAQTGVALSTKATSNTIVISGLAAAAPISVSGGTYSIGCSATGFTAQAKTISNGQSVCVRHVSSANAATTVTTMLSIGGVSGDFSSTTAP